MKPFVSYLFARGVGTGSPAPCLALRPDDPAPAALTVLLAANGLFARVATPALQATLPLVDVDDGDEVAAWMSARPSWPTPSAPRPRPRPRRPSTCPDLPSPWRVGRGGRSPSLSDTGVLRNRAGR